MQPNSPENNGVWISREEYERLSQAQNPPYVTAPTVTQSGFASTHEKSQSPLKVLVGVLLAVGFYVSLTFGGSSIFVIILLVLSAAYVTVTAIDAIRSRSKNPALVQSSNHRRVYKTIFIILAVIIAAPVLAYVGLMILLFSLFALGGGRGS